MPTAADGGGGQASGQKPEEERQPRQPNTRYESTSVTKLTPYVAPAPTPAPAPAQSAGAGIRAGRPKNLPPAGVAFIDGEAEYEPRFTPDGMPGFGKTKKSYSMTWEEYRKLDDEQRAAVDFNTMLVEAREKDLNTEYAPSPSEKELYDRQVKEMFGEDGGSETYAPEVVSVLKQLDYDPQSGAEIGNDLDDFLGLKVLIRDKDIAKIGKPAPLAKNSTLTALGSLFTGESNSETRTDLQRVMVDRTAALRDAMSRGTKVLQTYKQWTDTKRNDNSERIGGDGDYMDFRKSFEDSKLQEAFNVSFEALAATGGTDDSTWKRISQGLTGPGELAAFKKFARAALETPGYADAAAQNGWMKPEEYLALLQRVEKDGD